MLSAAKRTPLFQCHAAAGGRIVEFAGYDLPVQYDGVIAESKAVREGAGMFDVSHMARLSFTGGKVLDYLEHVTANDVADLADMQGQYSLLPNANGGTVDDIILYRLNEAEYHMVVNAANHEKDVAHLKAQNNHGVEIRDYSERTAMIAVQGPRASAILAEIADNSPSFESLGLFGCAGGVIDGQEVFMARSGYTGEDGFELICPADFAATLWDRLADAGVVPCGLGARDTLRVEAGLPLYGHELGDELSPIAAGLGWVVSKKKEFLGSAVINQVREQGPPVKLQGIRLGSKRVPPVGAQVSALTDDNPSMIGTVSSGVYSPLLDCGIGFAFLAPDIKPGVECTVDVRGTEMPATVTNKRFFKRHPG